MARCARCRRGEGGALECGLALARSAIGTVDDDVYAVAHQDCSLDALSSASGPSTSAPRICPRSAILHNAAASIVEGTLAVTVSIPLKIATRTS